MKLLFTYSRCEFIEFWNYTESVAGLNIVIGTSFFGVNKLIILEDNSLKGNLAVQRLLFKHEVRFYIDCYVSRRKTPKITVINNFPWVNKFVYGLHILEIPDFSSHSDHENNKVMREISRILFIVKDLLTLALSGSLYF